MLLVQLSFCKDLLKHDNLQSQIGPCQEFKKSFVTFENGKISFSFRYIAMACDSIKYSAKQVKDTIYIIGNKIDDCYKHQKPYRVCGEVAVPENNKYRVVINWSYPYSQFASVSKWRTFFDGVVYNSSKLKDEVKIKRPKEGFIPDEETAISIAKSILKPIYGDKVLNNVTFKASLLGNVWKIEGSKSDNIKIKVPSVELNKNTGEIIKLFHIK